MYTPLLIYSYDTKVTPEPAEVLIDTITGGEKAYEGGSKMTVQELQKKLLNLQYEGLRWQQMCTLYPEISISFKLV